MLRVGKLGAEAARFREMQDSAQILDVLEECFRFLAASRVLVTGVPLPGRSLGPLLLRAPHINGDSPLDDVSSGDDPLFSCLLGLNGAKVLVLAEEYAATHSRIISAIVATGLSHAVCVPVRALQPYQAAAVGFGADITMNRFELLALQYACEEAFRQLLALGAVSPERPGDLSARERKVVELSAAGRTANDIATTLAISQRTVHAHLQNASEKLRARNKTHTVVEAYRYGQIRL